MAGRFDLVVVRHDLERAERFYVGVLGFQLTQQYGAQAAFVSAGGYHHHLGLNTWESLGGSPPPPGHTGLYHTAILYPTRATLADALRRLIAAEIPLDGASDHGVSEALYLRDPDGNGVELYWDRPEAQWPRDAQGGLELIDLPMTRTDIGDYLGMTIETVSRNLSKLRDMGILRLKNTRCVEILRADKLRLLSE